MQKPELLLSVSLSGVENILLVRKDSNLLHIVLIMLHPKANMDLLFINNITQLSSSKNTNTLFKKQKTEVFNSQHCNSIINNVTKKRVLL